MRNAEILVVDDSATQLEALRSLLEDAGYVVHTARDGVEALSRLGSDGIDLVLSDVIMPGMSGYELCTAIKEQKGEDSPPVVLLTSLADPTDIVRGLECGADNYITKPYEPEHLLGRIRQVLDNRELRRDRPRGGAVPIRFLGETFTIRSDREQVLDLLLSSFEELIRTNDALQESKRALAEAHTRELQHEQEARSAAEQSARRMELFARASAALSSSLEEQEALHTVAHLMCSALGGACVIETTQENGDARASATAYQDEHARTVVTAIVDAADHRAWTEWHDGEEPVVLAPPPPEFVRAIAPAAVSENGTGLDISAALIAPLIARGRRVGTMMLLRLGDTSPFATDDVRSVREIAGRVALAVDNLRLFRQAERDRAAAEDAAGRLGELYDSERRARAEAEAATRIRDEVLAIVSHDLRNPLGIIFTGTSLLLDLDLDEEKRTRQLRILRRAAERMERLISDLLEVSRLESGRLTIQKRTHDVDDILRDAGETFQPLAEEKRITLEIVRAGLGPVHVDRERISQVFSNLVGNAIKFTPEGGRIRISASAGEDDVVFTVADTGPGIPESDLPRIFDRFWQARRTAQAGAGLGLAIAKGIVEAHGGRIWAESDEGRGARFHFAVPRVSARVSA